MYNRDGYIFSFYLCILCVIRQQGWKTKSKFKEVLQMSYLKPSCNCKFCQLWEKVLPFFIIANTNPTVNLNDALFTSSPERCAKTTLFQCGKNKIAKWKKKKKNFQKHFQFKTGRIYIIYFKYKFASKW